MQREIKMVELGAQYQRLKSEIDEAIFSVLQSCQFIKGPFVFSFEKNLANYLTS
jgi:UDP-2-acetamido-2-deoxy-ribo-hexuluronate aminotransferase